MIKLYKDGKLVDFGVKSKMLDYMMMGYQIKFDSDPEPIHDYKVREFDALWETLPAAEKKHLDFAIDDDELDIDEKLAYLKAAIAVKKLRPKPKKIGFFGKVRNLINKAKEVIEDGIYRGTDRVYAS